MSADHVLEQLHLIRAENEKRDRELALLRAGFVLFRSQLDVFGTHQKTILSMLGTHTDVLHEINEQLLALQASREGEP